MTELMQITLEGELEPAGRASLRRRGLTTAQLRILRAIDAAGDMITTIAAGRIIHEMREKPCERCADREDRCAFVAIDGREALERLAARGVVRKVSGGLWSRA